MPVHLKKPLKDGDTTGGGQGRMYDKELAAKPGNIKIGEVALGMQLAIVAITDDKEGTLEQIGKGNPWHIHAMELVTGSTANAFKPLSQILPDHMGFELDRAFSHTKITGGLHCVDTQGYIAHNENDVVLAYRCTIGGFDWLTNFSASTSEFEPEEDAEQGHSGFLSCLDGRCMGDKPRVHTGFYNGFLVSQPDVLELLEPHIKDSKTPKRIFVVGHSLGAGVATVAFIYLLLKYNWLLRPHKLILVTAGGPRVCDESMAIKVQNKVKELRPQDKCCICRLVRDQDVVPNVPLGLMGFRHLNKLLYFNKSGELMINPAVESADDDQEEKTAVEAPANVMEEMKDLKEKVFDHEAYKQVLNMIPGRFVDHMPDMYLEPLMGILVKTEPLQLKIISARGLKNADWIGVSDPYCSVKIDGKSDCITKTEQARGTLSPEWNHSALIHNYAEGDILEFEIWDYNTARKDTLLGRASLDSKRFHKWGWEGELPLTDTGHDKEAVLKVRASWR